MIPSGFKGAARKLQDIDIPRLARVIGVGEDEIHAVIEVETSGGGFDAAGRPKMLFEPHIFWAELAPARRPVAAGQGLAYPRWGEKPYPKDSYPRLELAIRIDRAAALRSASWALGQILGRNARSAGFADAETMVAVFCETEASHLKAMIDFIRAEHLDDDLRRHDWSGFARGYNGAGYAAHGYHTKLATAFAKWQRIRDTPLPPGG